MAKCNHGGTALFVTPSGKTICLLCRIEELERERRLQHTDYRFQNDRIVELQEERDAYKRQNKVAEALNDLMTAEHSLVNAQCVLAEHINDLQERIEELAEIERTD